MRLENARHVIETASGDALRLVETAHADLLDAIAELRRIAHGVHQ
jgi:signal transduction histidine kinase